MSPTEVVKEENEEKPIFALNVENDELFKQNNTHKPYGRMNRCTEKEEKYAMKEYITHYVKYKRKQITTVQDIDYMKTTTRNEKFKQRQMKIQLTTSTIMKTY
jgi:hypothetical protein